MAAGIVIVVLNNKSILHTRAEARVAGERSMMNSEMTSMREEQKTLRRDEAKYDKIIEDNQSVINNVESLRSQLALYDTDLENANATNAELDNSISENQAYLDSLNSIKETTDGEERTLKDGNYKSPSDLSPGKYRAEGTGIILLKNIANAQKDRIDLSITDTHSYVFEIASGESINVNGEITLTELISEN
ncbi:MAG: hypothetical protein J1G06_02780 [Oscillospiraceae bacterium]|nr:hypothetical protein [Oscillospiraceae bacterium]